MDEYKEFKIPDWSEDPKLLRKVYTKTDFDSVFYKLIAKDVIRILSPQLASEPHNLTYNEDRIHRHLLAPLERFICNIDVEDDSPEAQAKVDGLFESLKALQQTSKMCRKVLKSGDVLFSCNDCGFDATCVVCIDCFLKSEHKNHNYRMSNTDGGGCCDCGDVEAWKQYPACANHQAPGQNLTLSDFEDLEKRSFQIEQDRNAILEKLALLPDAGLASRFFLICQACLHYARELISWDEHNRLPEYLEITEQDFEFKDLIDRDTTTKNYFTVVFNDEVHTYDHVINTLVKIIKCTKMTASVIASTVSREGRSFIARDQYEPCYKIRSAILYFRESDQGPLKVEVIHGSILAHQAYALRLIEWVQKMSSLCDAFRVVTAYTLLGNDDPLIIRENEDGGNTDWTLLEKVMISNTKYWKLARILWNDLFVSTLLSEYSIKDKFARLITRRYERLVDDYLKDDHDHSVSILTMTTQLYTVPSLVCMLIEEEDALGIISKTIVRVCTRRDAHLSIGHRFSMESLRRGFSIISDLRHLISIEPTKWTPILSDNVIEAVRIFLEQLFIMQDMDSVKRQLGQHVEYEPEWEAGMNLQGRLIGLISRLVQYCSLDKVVLTEILAETQRLLFKVSGHKKVHRELLGYQTFCINYDVSSAPVSVHLPLTRFAAALIIELMQRKPCDTIPYDESLVILVEPPKDSSSIDYSLKGSPSDTMAANRRYSMIEIMEPSLRTEVMIAQFRSGMWRRNGFSLINQILYFTGAMMRKEMFDRDILCIQECAATCDANKFMLHLLNKFNLFTWISSETTREPLVGPKAVSFYNDEEILTQTMSLAEEFIQLLLIIVGERYRVGIGKIEPDDAIKNELIHLLCIQPSTRSDLAHKLCVNETELDCIKTIANLRRSNESALGKYELKEDYYHRFNPFFYHYNRRQQSQAIDAQLKRRRLLKESLICCPPPALVELTEQFKNLNELLKCDITLFIIQKVLRRALGPPADAQECSTKAPIRFTASDLQLDQCLHLIGLSLYEQERDPIGYNYLLAAHAKDIFILLKECHDKAQRSKDLIHWLMKRTDDLIGHLYSIHDDTLDEQQQSTYTQIREHFAPILSTCDTIKQESKQRNSEMASQRRERIMAMMKAKQDRFLQNPATKQLAADTARHESPRQNHSQKQQQHRLQYQLLGGTTTTTTNTTTTTTANAGSDHDSIHREASQAAEVDEDEKMEVESIAASEDAEASRVGVSQIELEPAPSYLCILCRDEQCVGFDKTTLVLLSYVQRSSVLSKNRIQRRIPYYSLTPSNQLRCLRPLDLAGAEGTERTPDKYGFTSDNSWSFDATFMPSDTFFGPYISTCGHVMHYDCWRGYLDAVTKRETSRPNRNARHVSFELEKGEVLCPLCECISNATIPLLPEYTRFTSHDLHESRTKKPTSVDHQMQCDDRSQPGVFHSSLNSWENSSDSLGAFLSAMKASITKFKHIRHLQKPTQQPKLLSQEEKYMRLLQPAPLNDVLSELGECEALSLRDFISTIRAEKISSSACTKNLLECINHLAERIHVIAMDFDKSIFDVDHGRIFMLTSWGIAYTIQANERSLRFRGAPIFEDLESTKNLCVSSLIRAACASMMTYQSDMIQNSLIRKLRYLLVSDEHLMASPCILDIDTFELFVSLFILLQKLYAHIDDTSETLLLDPFGSSIKSTSSRSSTGSTAEDQNYGWTTRAYDHAYFRDLLHLILIMNALQVILSMQSGNDEALVGGTSSEQTDDNSSTPTAESLMVHNFYKDMITASGHPNQQLPPVTDDLVRRLKRGLLPFLRCCAMFFYQLSHIRPNTWLKTKTAFHEGRDFSNSAASESDKQQKFDRACTSDEEFKAICEYLSLPTNLINLLNNQDTNNLARSWLHHSRVPVLLKEQAPTIVAKPMVDQKPSNELMPLKMIFQPHPVNRLIDLPYDYSELVDKVSNFTCPSIKNEDSRTPTMCLVCGAMLCSQSYCCQRDLNSLASNYQQVIQLQHEVRTQLLNAFLIQNEQANSSSSSSSGGGTSSGSSAAHFLRTRRERLAAAGGAQNQPTAPENMQAMPDAGATTANAAPDAGSPMGGSYRASWEATYAAASFAAALSNINTAPNLMPTIHQQLVGSCTYHAHECSGGVGIFLRIRNCQVLLLNNRAKGCYFPAPYIDDHGETDFGLLRGNPLHLNRQHYERLQMLWMNHAIPEQISRTLEYSSHMSNINWHLH